MNHSQLIKRAFTITWRYRVLWLFGILLALTSGGGGGGGGGSGRGSNTTPDNPFSDILPDGFRPESLGLDRIDWSQVAGIIFACCCLMLIWIVLATILQYVARTALYRSVDQIESSGVAPKWRQGFRLGWSNRSFRLWLLDLVIGIPAAIVAVLLLILGASPLLLLLARDSTLTVIGIAMTVGLELLIILLLIVAGVILGVLGQFWQREIALADRGIGQALAEGYALARRRAKDVAGMWLLMLGIGIGRGLLTIVLLFFILALAAAVGGGLGFLVHSLTDSIRWAVAAGAPLFLIILVVPLTFVEGLWLAFESAVWTLTYRATLPAQQD